jgi:hypothetical protein
MASGKGTIVRGTGDVTNIPVDVKAASITIPVSFSPTNMGLRASSNVFRAIGGSTATATQMAALTSSATTRRLSGRITFHDTIPGLSAAQFMIFLDPNSIEATVIADATAMGWTTAASYGILNNVAFDDQPRSLLVWGDVGLGNGTATARGFDYDVAIPPCVLPTFVWLVCYSPSVGMNLNVSANLTYPF